MTGRRPVQCEDMVRDLRPSGVDVSAWVLTVRSGLPILLITAVQRCASRVWSRSYRANYRASIRAASSAFFRALWHAYHRAPRNALLCVSYRAVARAFNGALLCAAAARVSPRLSALSAPRLPARAAPRTLGAVFRPLLRDIQSPPLGADARAFRSVAPRVSVSSKQGVIHRPKVGALVGAVAGAYRAWHTALSSAHGKAASSACYHASEGRLEERDIALCSTPCFPRDIPRLERRYQRVTCRVMLGVA